MAEDRVCARCGTVLKAYAGGRLCPTCLLRGGLEAGADLAPVEEDSPAARPASLPHTIGDYELLEVIARGGMGVVYRARQKSLNRVVAVKMLLAGEFAAPKFVERFRAEAEAVARLQHPGIVAIHDVGEHDGHPFFSMDYVEGKNLAQVISDLGFQISDCRRSASWLKSIADAVHYAHQRGILHRDLKPSNVLIDALEQPHLTDFGLSKRFTLDPSPAEDPSSLTLSGQVLGSPNYLPPEQAEGRHARVGPSSDVYSLGAILYHLLTGRPPFQGESLTMLLKQVVETAPVAPRLLNPGLPRDLETICLKCLEKDARKRYPTAQDVADELGRFLQDLPIQARPVNAVGRVVRWCHRQPVRAGLSAALILTFLFGMTGIAWQLKRARAGELLALRHAYAGDIREAQRAFEEGDLGGARRTLDKYRPGEPASGDRQPTLTRELRGWEWRYLWGLCRSDDQPALTNQSNGFEDLAFSSDGSLLAVRQSGGNIDLWDWAGRHLVGTLTNKSRLWAMAFVPGGNLLASSTSDTNGPGVCFWDATTRRIVRTLPHPTPVHSLAFSPDGEWLATFDVEPRLRLWRVRMGELVAEILGPGKMNALGRVALFSPDSATLALGEMDGSIRLLSLKNGRITTTLPAPTEGNGVTALAFSPDGRILASGHGQSDGTVRFWDAVSGAEAGSLKGHRGWVTTLVFAPDGRTLYSGSSDQTIRVWDVAQQQDLGRLRGHTRGISGLAPCRDGNTLVSCARDGSIRVWDVQSKPQRASHAVLPVRVGPHGATFTRDSRDLITASAEAPVTIWDVASAAPIRALPALGTNQHSVALSPDDRLLAVGGLDGTIKIWDLVDQRLVKVFRPQPIPIVGLRFWDGGKTLLSHAVVVNRQRAVQRWDVASWVEIPFGRMDVSDTLVLAQSPDQRLLAVPSRDGLRLWDYATGQLRWAFTAAPAGVTATFTADSRRVAACIAGGARVWEVGSWRELAALSLHANAVVSLAFSPDGQRLVTGGEVGMGLQPALVVWDYAIQRPLIGLQSDGGWTSWTTFSPDGNTLLALTWGGVAELYRAPSWEEIAREEKGQGVP
jgi:WD40 repeat protein